MRAGWKESGEGSSELFPLFLNKVCLFEDTCALEPLMRLSGDLKELSSLVIFSLQ